MNICSLIIKISTDMIVRRYIEAVYINYEGIFFESDPKLICLNYKIELVSL